MSEKLLPCPFCGGEASLALTNREDERSGYRATFSAYCKTCSGMTARTSTTDKNGWNNEVDESIKRRVTEAWNRRTPAPEGEAVAWRLRRVGVVRWNLWDLDPRVDTPAYADAAEWEVQPLYASPVVPVGVSREVVENLRRKRDHPTSETLGFTTIRTCDADAIIAALRPTDTGANHD